MAHSKIQFGGSAREKVLRGAMQLADAIRVTLGPKPKSVLIQTKWGNPMVCSDGVTIAKKVDLQDPRRASARRCCARPLCAPARIIAENSAVDAGVVVARMLVEQDCVGFDTAANRYVDMYEAGIIDPTKVVRVALENGVSVASVLLLSEATMTEIAQKGSPEPPPFAG